MKLVTKIFWLASFFLLLLLTPRSSRIGEAQAQTTGGTPPPPARTCVSDITNLKVFFAANDLLIIPTQPANSHGGFAATGRYDYCGGVRKDSTDLLSIQKFDYTLSFFLILREKGGKETIIPPPLISFAHDSTSFTLVGIKKLPNESVPTLSVSGSEIAKILNELESAPKRQATFPANQFRVRLHPFVQVVSQTSEEGEGPCAEDTASAGNDNMKLKGGDGQAEAFDPDPGFDFGDPCPD